MVHPKRYRALFESYLDRRPQNYWLTVKCLTTRSSFEVIYYLLLAQIILIFVSNKIKLRL